jgi:hypothetical protein
MGNVLALRIEHLRFECDKNTRAHAVYTLVWTA